MSTSMAGGRLAGRFSYPFWFAGMVGPNGHLKSISPSHHMNGYPEDREMSEDMAFSNEEIGELIEFLRKEGLDPCDDAADLIEQQQSELSALREALRRFVDNSSCQVNQPEECEQAEALLSTGSNQE